MICCAFSPRSLRHFGEQLFDRVGDLRAQGLIRRIEAGDHLAPAIDEILLEVPFNLAVERRVFLPLSQIAIERRHIVALDADLGE